jgi:tetratricopeptide (TPR) repeat protein
VCASLARAGVCGAFVAAGPALADETPPAPVPDAPTSIPAAAPSEGDARQQLEQAMQLYESGRYAEALEVFERVYALQPNPAVLFNIGAVHAALQHCELARDAYRRYIEQTRSESGRADAQQQLERLNECEAAPPPVEATAAAAALPPSEPALAAPPEAPVTSSATAAASETPPPAPVATTDLPPPMATDSPPNAMRVAGWVAIGAGGVLGLASLGCAYASWRADDADSGASPGQSGDAAAREQDAGQRYNSLAWGLAGGAAALAGSGLLLLWLQPDEQTSVQVAAPGGGLGLSLEQRF